MIPITLLAAAATQQPMDMAQGILIKVGIGVGLFIGLTSLAEYYLKPKVREWKRRFNQFMRDPPQRRQQRRAERGEQRDSFPQTQIKTEAAPTPTKPPANRSTQPKRSGPIEDITPLERAWKELQQPLPDDNERFKPKPDKPRDDSRFMPQ